MLGSPRVAHRINLDNIGAETMTMDQNRVGGEAGSSGVNLRGGDEANPPRPVLPVATPNVKQERN